MKTINEEARGGTRGTVPLVPKPRKGRQIMRYYNFTLATTIEYIEANTKTRLKDHSYENTISAVNAFMYKYLKNNILSPTNK